jgi:hypothetical protein
MTGSMPHRSDLRTVLCCCAVLVVGACEKDKLKGPEAEVRKSEAKLSIPAVPGFELPPSNPDGSHSVKEMRVKGRKLLDTEITVKGYVTWAYDCPTALKEPGMSDKDVQKMIDEDPTKCERPKFYVGDTAETPAEKSMWVVDVPRAFNFLELKRLNGKAQAEELAQPNSTKCDGKKKDLCPVYKVGDQIEVTGVWKMSSPHSERNSDGLLVYRKMKNVTQNWESPAPAEGGAAKATGTPEKPSPEDIVKKKGAG